jgi:hypothetical protein
MRHVGLMSFSLISSPFGGTGPMAIFDEQGKAFVKRH